MIKKIRLFRLTSGKDTLLSDFAKLAIDPYLYFSVFWFSIVLIGSFFYVRLLNSYYCDVLFEFSKFGGKFIWGGIPYYLLSIGIFG